MNNEDLKEYRLDNGLELKLIDKSREITSDMVYVCVLVRIVVPLKSEWFDEIELGKLKFKNLLAVMGTEIIFEQKHERHFVKKSLKEETVSTIRRNVLDLSVKYFSNYKFPGKLILNRFLERQ